MRITCERLCGIAIIAALVVLCVCSVSSAASLTLSALPIAATANSVWTFEAVWKPDDDGVLPVPSVPEGADRTQITGDGVVWLNLGVPMYYAFSAADGRHYRVSVSAGLNMSNDAQNPYAPAKDADGNIILDGDGNPTYVHLPAKPSPLDSATYIPDTTINSLIWDSHGHPMCHTGSLVAGGGGAPRSVGTIQAFAYKLPEAPAEGAELAAAEEVKSNEISVTVYDSRTATSMINYGGNDGDRDWLTCHPLGNWPSEKDVDPLTVEPTLDSSGTNPQDGSTSHQFVFRVRYHNKDNRPPLPWAYKGSGVTLYLDPAGTGDYRAYNMLPEDPALTAEDAVYIIRFLPRDTIGASPYTVGEELPFPGWITSGWAYNILSCGTYHYFFGCSDDYLTFADPGVTALAASDTLYALNLQPDLAQWGVNPDAGIGPNNTPLDPMLSRAVTGYSDIDRAAHRRYSTNGSAWYDYTIHADRVIRAPGFFDNSQPNMPKSSEHPRISCALTMPYSDSQGVAYNNLDKYGGGRFYGTLQPFKRAVNPLLPGAFTYTTLGQRAETCGATTKTENVFRIQFRQIDGKAPQYVKLFINNAGERSGTDAAHQYTAYPMDPDPEDTVRNYKNGVMFSIKLTSQLIAGSHTYYFESYDGENKVIWPRRPDLYTYGGHTFRDWWVPTESTPVVQNITAAYDDNDFVPGPFVNAPCVLSDYSVTPSTGKLGQSFNYRVKYADPDGQRPYSAYVYIRNKNNPGSQKKYSMNPEVLLYPTANNSAQWKQGVYFSISSVAMSDLNLTVGNWEYRFEIQDDWGRQTDPSDMIPGETTSLPSAALTWYGGPTVKSNQKPTLNRGKVESQDGTANSATLWTYRVNYMDGDGDVNDVPTVKVFIGLLQPDGKTVLWDDGHAMLKDNPNDNVYTNGVDYYYQTRLRGKLSDDDSEKQYFYAFVAYDGAAWAEYNSSTSPSAGVVVKQVLNSADQTNYSLTPPVAGGKIVGPLPVQQPTPPGVLFDAEIRKNNTIVSIDDLKNGWQNPPDDIRYSMMRGIATELSGKDSTDYVVPEDPSLIATVEGVYTDIDDLVADTNNYYIEPGRAGESLTLWASRNTADQTGKTVVPYEGWRIASILGVYESADLSGTNYMDGGGQVGLDGRITLTSSLPEGVDYVYVSYLRTGFNMGDRSIWLTEPLPDDQTGQTVYIKYSDIRFTHLLRGYTWDGTTYIPDAINIAIKGNEVDPLNGVLGVWLNAYEDGTNFFDPRRVSYKDNLPDDPNTEDVNEYGQLPLTTATASGGEYMWARLYQTGDYNIDRWNGLVQFLPGHEPDAGNTVTATYVFGTSMKDANNNDRLVGANTPPKLELVRAGVLPLTPLMGSKSGQYVYTIKYTDTDGQAPDYVRVYIDNVPFIMAPTAGAIPAYRDGAIYTYTATNLTAGEHRYRFEASDGADVAIFDQYSFDGTVRPDPSVVTEDTDLIVDMLGPWVNDPPTLSNGACDPSGQGGNISVTDYVTFTVTYTDTDGDAPYPLGTDTTGVPMLWVDCGGDTDAYFAGKVAALEPDPLETSKKRVIVATKSDGSAPGWTAGQYAGKLMQITDGTSSDRLYLIQNNTVNSLTIAVDDMGTSGENLAIGSAFRINALRMRKVDVAAQDFTLGVGYTITVPRLAVGAHKFKFSARSKLTKPTWLIAQETAAAGESLPYSAKVTYPTTGELTGPTVTSTPPTGNAIPVLSNTAQTAVYNGPKVNSALVLSSSLIKLDTTALGSWTEQGVEAIRQILGVYRNANADPADNYYDTTQTFDPLVGEISLSPELGAVPPELVQFGRVNTSLLEVTPDSINAIQTIIGIYDNADLTGTNYKGASAMAVGDTVLKLGTPLPSGTKRVYIKYAPMGGVEPPVYIQYFDKHTADTVFLAGEPLTFRVSYSDADGDPPAYNYATGVTGYLRAVVGSAGIVGDMLPLTPSVTDYSVTTPATLFTVTMTNVPEGQQTLYFEGSDGYTGHVVKVPTTSYQIKVNYRPTLTSAIVAGPQATLFKFTVTYIDLDGSGTNARVPIVLVRLINAADKKDYPITMSAANNPVYANGAVFTADTGGLQLPYGEYNVVFEASDGYQDALPLAYGSLMVREKNTPPQVVSMSVAPAAGKLSQTFIYSATYRDEDGDPPVVASGKGLTLVIDRGTSAVQRFTMTGPSAPTKAEYIAGVPYQVSVLGSKLGMGQHTYTVEATDGTDSATVPTAQVGPVLLVPLFANFRVVSAAAADPDAASAVSSAAVGENVLIVGRVKFPKNAVTGKPATINNVTIQVTKPDSTTVSLTGSVTMLSDAANTDTVNWVGKLSVPTYPMGVDPALVTGSNLTLSSSGTWKLSAVWGGDAKWDKVQTDENSDGINDGFSLTVGGPMRTVTLKDPSRPEDAISNTPLVEMITPPMVIGSGDAGAIFRGYDRARQMQVVRWDPQTGAYYKYGLQASFPELLPGDAVWIKPKSDYPAESIKIADATSGLLALGNPDMTLDFTREYRLIKVFSKSYTTQVNSTGKTELAPCVIPLTAGWNQFGNIFFNWKTDAAGEVITPREDMGIPISELRVRFVDGTMSISEAIDAKRIGKYVWRFDAEDYKYVPVHATLSGAETVLKAWSGFWIRASMNCDLIIDPNTSYNGVAATASMSSLSSVGSSSGLASVDQLDMPPPMPQ